MKKLIYFVLLFIIAKTTLAQVSNQGMYILNPNDGGWWKEPAFFDSVKIKITPAGIYAQVEIEMDVSARNTGILDAYPNDSLEAEFRFSLPEGAHIHAAWLWMEGVPVQAELYERNLAQLIYESLVSRSVDPLIIYKNGNNQYEARIYPFLGEEPRKFKLSILVPVAATASTIELPLMLPMFKSLQTGNTPDIYVELASSSLWGTPQLWPTADNVTNTADGISFILHSNDPDYVNPHALYFKHPNSNTAFITQAASADEGYYQLFLPPVANAPGERIAFVLDYSGTSADYPAIKSFLESKMYFELSANDSFMLLYTHNGNVIHAGNQWLPADSTTVSAVFANMQSGQNSTNLYFQSLMNAIHFINDHGDNGTIYMISNNSSTSSNPVDNSNDVHTLIANMHQTYPVHSVQVSSHTAYDVYANDGGHMNNGYFLSNLAALTGGSYSSRFTRLNGWGFEGPADLYTPMTSGWNKLFSLSVFDEVTYDFSGFLANRYTVPHVFSSNPRHVYMETGRYFGSGAITISRSTMTDDYELHQSSYELQATEDDHQLSRKIWAGNYIDELVRYNSNDMNTGLIVSESIEYQVLSPYTAFLALEPDTTVATIKGEEGGNTGITESPAAAFDVKAVPSPFTDVQVIHVALGEDMKQEKWSVAIYDLSGRVVWSQNGKTSGAEALVIQWDGGALSAGNYIIRVQVGQQNASVMVVKQ